MAISFPDRLRGLQTALNTKFQSWLGAYKPTFGMLFDETTSTERTELYTWPTRFVRMREWLGDRQINGAANFYWEVANKTFELTFGADREDIEDDRFNTWDPQIRNMSMALDVHIDDFAIDLLQNGTSTPCYDGTNWFSGAHPIDKNDSGSATFSNNFTGTALSQANFLTRYYAGMELLGQDGLPLSIQYTHLIVPPQLAATGRRILEMSTVSEAGVAAGVDNVSKGLCELVVAPRLANQATTWYLADLSKPLKPFIHQTRRPFSLTTLFDPDSPNVFLQKQFLFGLDGRDAATVTMPQLMARCIA